MTIKARLVVSTAMSLCLATVVIGVVAIGAVTISMTKRVDSQLREFVRQPRIALGANVMPPGNRANLIDSRVPAYQAVAVMFLDGDGSIVAAANAGYHNDPLPLPLLPDPLPEPGRIVAASSPDSATGYRLLVAAAFIRLRPGDTPQPAQAHRLVVAAPMTEVATVRRQLITTMVVTVATVLLLSVIANWWIARRGLRPVDEMIDTAVAIAAGDLERRAGESDRHTELGRLARALNTMVSKLVTEQARLRRFVADASHELRTPLATIGGYADLYESGGARSGPMLDRAMTRIRAESRRMAKLIDDMLTLARFDQEGPAARPGQAAPPDRPGARCDLLAVVTDCVDDARATSAGGHSITLDAAEPVVVPGHEARLRQVLVNLLDNACRHTPPGTTIRVSLASVGGEAVLVVADDGPGIAEEHRSRVFDRFYRVDPSRSRATGGAGLGLSIVASIVGAHRGAVELESEVGGGTVVRVRLPLDAVREGST